MAYSPLDFLVTGPKSVLAAERVFPSFVYVIQSGDGGAVKIGSAGSPSKRLRSLQTGSPEGLALIGVIACRHCQFVEKRAHAILKEHWLRGEWFDLSPLEAIEGVLAAAREDGGEARPVWADLNGWVARRGLTTV